MRFPKNHFHPAIMAAAAGRAAQLNPWTVENDAFEPAVSLGSLIARVPLGDSGDIAEAVKLHEAMHVRYSPVEGPEACAAAIGVNPAILYLCEEARVNRLAMEHGGEEIIPKLIDETCPAIKKGATGTKADVACAILRSAVNPKARKPTLLPKLDKVWEETRAHVAANKRKLRNFAWTEELARKLDTALREAGEGEGEGEGAADAPGDAQPGGVSPVPTLEGEADWIQPTLLTPPRTEPCISKHGGRATRASYAGRLRKPMRLRAGGKAFGRRRRASHRGGAVLIDASGSMGWDPEKLLALIEALPLATVGVYSSTGHEATLRVYAHRGRRARHSVMAAIEREAGCGNGCDGPALAWLGKQDGPRFWLSDGGVTGVGEACSHAHIRDAARLCAAHAITRIDPTDERELARKLLLPLAEANGK